MSQDKTSNRKASLLSRPVEHVDIKSFDARPIIAAMDHMSFSSRDIARAADIYNAMLEDRDCTIILTLAGSTSAGGCMDAYAELAEGRTLIHLSRSIQRAGLDADGRPKLAIARADRRDGGGASAS